MLKTKRSQIWVETVTYTLIGLSIIALLLIFLKPTVESTRDKIVTEQTINALNKIGEKIESIKRVAGNKRSISVKITKGNLIIDGKNEKISWIFDSKYQYSESGKIIALPGNMRILTTSVMNESWITNITLDYSEETIDLRYNNQNTEKVLNQATLPYNLYIENMGTDTSIEKVVIDVTQE